MDWVLWMLLGVLCGPLNFGRFLLVMLVVAAIVHIAGGK